MELLIVTVTILTFVTLHRYIQREVGTRRQIIIFTFHDDLKISFIILCYIVYSLVS